MCYAASCNPTCGKCRPKRIVEAPCPSCGAVGTIGREEFLLLFDLPHRKNVMDEKIIERGGPAAPSCKFCGADMAEAFRKAVEPLPCEKSRIVCGFPCGGRMEPYREGAARCVHMVPVGKLPDATE